MNPSIAKAFATALAALAGHAVLAAEPYPARPVTMVTVFAPGSGAEMLQRLWTGPLAVHLGQKIILDHRVGGGGVPAAQAVARAKPDGYTLLFSTEVHVILRHLQTVPYDPIADFAPVSLVGQVPQVLVAHPKAGAATSEDLIARIRSAPGKLNYGSQNVGGLSHLSAAALLAVTGGNAVHVPFKGGPDMIRALVRGDVEFAFIGVNSLLPLVQSQQLRALAVTSAARVRQFPDVPTLLEVTKSDLLVQESWGGLWAPAKTPGDIVARLHAALTRTLSDPALLQEAEARFGATGAPSASPAEFAAFLKREDEKWREIVRLTGARAD